jgi:hypothetical protein
VLETSIDVEQNRQMKRDIRESEKRAAALRKLLPGGFAQQTEKKRMQG